MKYFISLLCAILMFPLSASAAPGGYNYFEILFADADGGLDMTPVNIPDDEGDGYRIAGGWVYGPNVQSDIRFEDLSFDRPANSANRLRLETTSLSLGGHHEFDMGEGRQFLPWGSVYYAGTIEGIQTLDDTDWGYGTRVGLRLGLLHQLEFNVEAGYVDVKEISGTVIRTGLVYSPVDFFHLVLDYTQRDYDVDISGSPDGDLEVDVLSAGARFQW